MTKNEWWLTFVIGKELDISGVFIYNSLKELDEINFFQEEEVFSVLYSLAIGIERLQKILLIIIGFDENKNYDETEEELITHNHVKLMALINERAKQKINFGRQHNKLIEILSMFYRNLRYSKFSSDELKSCPSFDKLVELNDIFSLGMRKCEILSTSYFNTNTFRRKFGNIVKKIVNEIFKNIEEYKPVNIYLTEMRYPSKQMFVFGGFEFNFIEISRAKKEVLLSLISLNDEDILRKIAIDENIIDLDNLGRSENIGFLLGTSISTSIIEELKMLYFEEEGYTNKSLKDRQRLLDCDLGEF